jgi:hypothetical protein
MAAEIKGDDAIVFRQGREDTSRHEVLKIPPNAVKENNRLAAPLLRVMDGDAIRVEELVLCNADCRCDQNDKQNRDRSSKVFHPTSARAV